MAELREQASTIFVFLAAPVAIQVVCIATVPEAVYLHHVDIAQFRVRQQLLHFLHGWIVPVLLYRKYGLARFFCCRYHPVALGYTYGHRFFYYSMQSCGQAGYGVWLMQVVRRTNAQDICATCLQHLFQAVIKKYTRRYIFLQTGIAIAHSYQCCVRVIEDVFGVAAAYIAVANYGKTDLVQIKK